VGAGLDQQLQRRDHEEGSGKPDYAYDKGFRHVGSILDHYRYHVSREVIRRLRVKGNARSKCKGTEIASAPWHFEVALASVQRARARTLL
jgi:hypothetical protein